MTSLTEFGTMVCSVIIAVFLGLLLLNDRFSGGDLDRYLHARKELDGIHPGDPYYTKVAQECKPGLRYYIIKYLLFALMGLSALWGMYYISPMQ